MLCVYTVARCLQGAVLSFVNDEEEDFLPIEGSAVEVSRRNPFTSSLGSSHWSWRLTCGVCLEFFRDPVILPCGHTFCRRCMQTLTEHERCRRTCIPTENIRFRCPECRHAVRTQAVRSRFVPNITAASVLEGWFDDLTSRELVDRKVQTSSRQSTVSTQTSPIPFPVYTSDSGSVRYTFSTYTNYLTETDHSKIRNRKLRRRNNGREDESQENVIDCVKRPRVVVKLPPDRALAPSPDQWGFGKQAKNSDPSWICPKSDISKYGWYINHFIFAFFLTMCFTDNTF